MQRTVCGHSQKVQAAERCELGVLHGRCYEGAIGRRYSAGGIATSCLCKRPSHLLQSFSLKISVCSRSRKAVSVVSPGWWSVKSNENRVVVRKIAVSTTGTATAADYEYSYQYLVVCCCYQMYGTCCTGLLSKSCAILRFVSCLVQSV